MEDLKTLGILCEHLDKSNDDVMDDESQKSDMETWKFSQNDEHQSMPKISNTSNNLLQSYTYL